MWQHSVQEASLEPVLHTIQGIHGDGIDHGYLALVVLEHKHQIHILHVELEDGRGTAHNSLHKERRCHMVPSTQFKTNKPHITTPGLAFACSNEPHSTSVAGSLESGWSVK